MHVTMIKKELADGSPCKKCIQAEDVLRRRGLWEQIDEVVMAKEADPASLGMRLAAEHRVELAPFFIVKDGEREVVYTSVIELMRERLATPMSAAPPPVVMNGNAQVFGTPAAPPPSDAPSVEEVDELNLRFAHAAPKEVVDWVLARYGESAAIAFSGAEDVAVIDMAASTGRPFSVFTLDTGRLHPETYRFIDQVRTRYGISIATLFPAHLAVEALVRKKGLHSFYRTATANAAASARSSRCIARSASTAPGSAGNGAIRARRAAHLEVFELDRAHRGATGGAMLKANPLAHSDAVGGVDLPARRAGAHERAPRPRLHLDRLRAMHARLTPGRARTREPLVVGRSHAARVRAAHRKARGLQYLNRRSPAAPACGV